MYRRYAAYFTAKGAFATVGAAWLGWDVAKGQPAPHPNALGSDHEALTQVPRKYGFHGTLKAPFRLAEGVDENQVLAELEALCSRHAPIPLEGLQISPLGRFLALTPIGDTTLLGHFAGCVVKDLEPMRADLTKEELKRRRKSNLSATQDAYLVAWGYPHVFDQFRFHMTLTGRAPKAAIGPAKVLAEAHFSNCLPAPFIIDALTLAGEREDGFFQAVKRVPLTG